MRDEEILEKVKGIIINQKGLKKVENMQLDTSFRKDLQFDSLGLVELALSCEDEFCIEIPPDDDKFNIVDTVGEAIEYFRTRLNE